MGLFDKFMKGHYKALIKCSNCGFMGEVKVPKGISIPDFVKEGKCICDNCKVVFYPREYTTEYFEKQKRNELVLKQDFDIKPKEEKKENYMEGIRWVK